MDFAEGLMLGGEMEHESTKRQFFGLTAALNG